MIEIRGFLQLDAFLKKTYGKMPFYFELEKPMSGLELSEILGIKREDIEVIFVNGFVQQVDFIIHDGDRIAFLPPGCPGPYRIALGFYGKNQDNEANFKIKTHIQVKLFATLREGREKIISLEVDAHTSVRDVCEILAIPYEDVAIIMINGVGVKSDTIVCDGDVLALFPPVGGG